MSKSLAHHLSISFDVLLLMLLLLLFSSLLLCSFALASGKHDDVFPPSRAPELTFEQLFSHCVWVLSEQDFGITAKRWSDIIVFV